MRSTRLIGIAASAVVAIEMSSGAQAMGRRYAALC